jgi:hypothetical protein
MSEERDAFPAQAVLMLSVALDELRTVEGEPDLAKVRIPVSSVEGTPKELLGLAKKAASD